MFKTTVLKYPDNVTMDMLFSSGNCNSLHCKCSSQTTEIFKSPDSNFKTCAKKCKTLGDHKRHSQAIKDEKKDNVSAPVEQKKSSCCSKKDSTVETKKIELLVTNATNESSEHTKSTDESTPKLCKTNSESNGQADSEVVASQKNKQCCRSKKEQTDSNTGCSPKCEEQCCENPTADTCDKTSDQCCQKESEKPCCSEPTSDQCCGESDEQCCDVPDIKCSNKPIKPCCSDKGKQCGGDSPSEEPKNKPEFEVKQECCCNTVQNGQLVKGCGCSCGTTTLPTLSAGYISHTDTTARTPQGFCLCSITKELKHRHNNSCGHPLITHNGHLDFIVDGRLHHQHGDHCDDHGPIEIRSRILGDDMISNMAVDLF